MRSVSLALTLPYTLASYAGLLLSLELGSRSVQNATSLISVLVFGSWLLPFAFTLFCLRCL